MSTWAHACHMHMRSSLLLLGRVAALELLVKSCTCAGLLADQRLGAKFVRLCNPVCSVLQRHPLLHAQGPYTRRNIMYRQAPDTYYLSTHSQPPSLNCSNTTAHGSDSLPSLLLYVGPCHTSHAAASPSPVHSFSTRSNASCSSPFWYASIMMSQPP